MESQPVPEHLQTVRTVRRSGNRFRLKFIAGFVVATYLYLLCFDFSYDVLLGNLSLTGPVLNTLFYVVCCALATWIFLVLADRSQVLGGIYFIASPFIFATLFVELILVVYSATNSRGSYNLSSRTGPIEWLSQGPLLVATFWYIFFPPAFAGIAARWWLHRREQRRLRRRRMEQQRTQAYRR